MIEKGASLHGSLILCRILRLKTSEEMQSHITFTIYIILYVFKYTYTHIPNANYEAICMFLFVKRVFVM